jgi:hypothetical protein
MKPDKINTDANANRQCPKIKVVFYCRVATAAQLKETKDGWDIPAPVYVPEEMIRKNSK